MTHGSFMETQSSLKKRWLVAQYTFHAWPPEARVRASAAVSSARSRLHSTAAAS